MITTHSLAHLADDKTVLKNPHKGWYWHYFDNGFARPMYRDQTKPGEYYEDFPGLNHLYLRVDWADIQPKPDVFDWSVIDTVMEEWGQKGYTFAFRICCHESWPIQCFATPQWLYEMGCNGAFYERGETGGILTEPNHGTWEPDYGDPLFLEYLERFLKEFGRRFDGDNRVEYVDIGSYGVWGEGHTYFGSKKCFGLEVLKKHAYLHAKYFKETPILVNDDFLTDLYMRPQEEKKELQDFCLSLGMGIRDDSVLVGSWDYKQYHNVEYPELYQVFSENAPANIELAHLYHYTEEQAKAGLRAIEAARACRVSYMGFHGYPEEWLEKYDHVTEYLANRLGYWYFVHSVSHEETVYAGVPVMIELEWENAGFAPCYVGYQLAIRITGAEGQEMTYCPTEFDNRQFREGMIQKERYFMPFGEEMAEGFYEISIQMTEPKTGKVIQLAMKDAVKDAQGFYQISQIQVKRPEVEVCE